MAQISQRNYEENIKNTHLSDLTNLDVSKRKTKILISGILKNQRTITVEEPIQAETNQKNGNLRQNFS